MKLPDSVDVLADPQSTEHLSPTETQATTRRLATAYPFTPLPSIHDEVIAVRRAAVHWFEHRDRPDGEHVDHLTAALARGLSAWARHDLGDTRGALAFAQAGLMNAILSARHPGAEVWLRGMQSLIAYRAGWVHESLRYARLGASVPGADVGSSAIWLHSLVALTQATLGDALAASAALRAAQDARALARRDELDTIGGLFHFSRTSQDAYEAQTRVFIPGAERRAIECAQSVIAAAGSGPTNRRPMYDEMSARISIALAHANLDDVEAAAEALRPVLRLDPAWRVDGLLAPMMLVHQRLRRPMRVREARVRDLQEEIESFCQMPLFIDSFG
jgi:hypothetical protein